MVAILMENPKHGRHHFYSPQEAEAAKKHGWVVVEPVKPQEAAPPAPKAAKKK